MKGRVVAFGGFILAGLLALSQGVVAQNASRGQGQIAFISTREGEFKLFVMNADGSSVKLLADMNANHPVWSPDGRRILFSSGEGEEVHLYTVDASGGGLRQITSGQTYNYGASWSPDGTRIVFASRTKGKPFSLYIAKADGSGKRRLTNNLEGDCNPAWSPDGRRIAFERHTPDHSHIAVISPEGTNVVALTPKNDLFYDPAWSPDGARLAFGRLHEGEKEICVMNADGTGLATVFSTPGPFPDFSPSWSPDGKHLIASGNLQGNAISLYTIRADGSDLKRLTSTRFVDSSPSWSPVGKTVAAAQAPATAQASLPPEAQEAIEKGWAAAKKQEYKLALRHFDEARKTAPYAPEVLFNLGLAESKIPGRELAAMVWFKAFLAASPDAPQAQKVRDLYSQSEAAVVGTIRKLIDLEKDVAMKRPEGNKLSAFWKDATLRGIVEYQLRLGDIAGARQTAQLTQDPEAFNREVAVYKAKIGDVKGALEAAELVAQDNRCYTYDSIATYQAEMGDVAGALKTRELARRWGDCASNFEQYVAEARVKMGDIEAAVKGAELSGRVDMDSLFLRIGREQSKKGDVKGVMEAAKRLSYSVNEWLVPSYIAEAQTRKGDIEAALHTAKSLKDRSRDIVLDKIAYVLALKGDIRGARQTVAQISDPSIKEEIQRKIHIVSALLDTKNSGSLRERVDILLGFQEIIDILNSPKYPWFTDLPAYLKSLNTIQDPADIVWGVERVVAGELYATNPEKAGMLPTWERVKHLGKKGE
jgi:Tol biopolymer transport system component/tetratricopeptide (TPR) repeat protein